MLTVDGAVNLPSLLILMRYCDIYKFTVVIVITIRFAKVLHKYFLAFALRTNHSSKCCIYTNPCDAGGQVHLHVNM